MAGTSCSQSKRAAGLRYAPMASLNYTVNRLQNSKLTSENSIILSRPHPISTRILQQPMCPYLHLDLSPLQLCKLTRAPCPSTMRDMNYRDVFIMQIFLMSCCVVYIWAGQWSYAFLAMASASLVGEILVRE